MHIQCDSRSVALVVDPSFGNRLLSVFGEMPVWIVASPINDLAIDIARSSSSTSPNGGHVTRILLREGETVFDLFVRSLYAVDEHHGEGSGDFPYQRLIVFGVPSTFLTSELADELGLSPIVERNDGFTAAKR